MTRGKPGSKSRPAAQASLSGKLVRRPVVLATLLLDQMAAEPDEGRLDDFELWLRFVLSPGEATGFQRWSQDNPEEHRDLERQFLALGDENGLDGLLKQVRRVARPDDLLAGTALAVGGGS